MLGHGVSNPAHFVIGFVQVIMNLKLLPTVISAGSGDKRAEEEKLNSFQSYFQLCRQGTECFFCMSEMLSTKQLDKLSTAIKLCVTVWPIVQIK